MKQQTLLQFFLILYFTFATSLASAVAKSAIVITINIAFAAESLWTRAEIMERFEYTSSIYKEACDKKIYLKIGEIIELRDQKLQDIVGHLSSASVPQMVKILSLFTHKQPTLFYMRKSVTQFSDSLTELQAQAFTFDGPRSFREHEYIWNDPAITAEGTFNWNAGNLDWERFEELKPIHGTAIIAQYNSKKALHFTKINVERDLFSVDAHELGHIFLNDGSHRYTSKNIMSDDIRTNFDTDQCQLIYNYLKREKLRFESVKSGMKQICKLASKLEVPPPQYCE